VTLTPTQIEAAVLHFSGEPETAAAVRAFMECPTEETLRLAMRLVFMEPMRGLRDVLEAAK
jgi:hypothetical protein